MALTTPEIIAGAALIVSIGGYLNARYGVLLSLQRQIGLMDARLSRQEMKMDTLWPAVTDAVKEMLKQDTTPRKDDLLTRFNMKQDNLTYEEICELKEILQNEKKKLLPQAEYLLPKTKVYLIALGLMLAGIDTMLIDRGTKC